MGKIDNVDFEEDRYCPVFNRIIDCEWCYESLMGISKLAKKSAIKELDEIAEDKMEDAFLKCKKCKYSELTDWFQLLSLKKRGIIWQEMIVMWLFIGFYPTCICI